METHCSRASGAGLARYRDGHSREGGAQSGLLEARMPRARGAGGEGTPGTASGRGGPASAQPPFSLSLPLPTLGPVPAPSLTQTRILGYSWGPCTAPGTVLGKRRMRGGVTGQRASRSGDWATASREWTSKWAPTGAGARGNRPWGRPRRL